MLIHMIEIGGRHGAASRGEVAAFMGECALRRALHSGVLQQIWRGVVVHAASVLNISTRPEAVMLVAGKNAVVSGPSALELHGVTGAAGTDVHITVPYSRSIRSRPGLVIHQNHVDQADVVDIEGLPVFV